MPPIRPALCLLLAALTMAGGAALADEAAEVRALLTRGELEAALQRAERAAAAKPRDAQLQFLQIGRAHV